jgi:hypothetical protein
MGLPQAETWSTCLRAYFRTDCKLNKRKRPQAVLRCYGIEALMSCEAVLSSNRAPGGLPPRPPRSEA